MYHKILNVALFGFDTKMEDTICSVVCPKRLTSEVCLHATFDAEAFTSCDIAILDFPESNCTDLAALPPKKGRMIVICAPEEQAASFDEATLTLVDEIWPASVSPAYAASRFSKILERKKDALELAYTRQCLDTAIDSIPELVWFKDAKGAHLKVNEAFCETVGKTKEQVEGRGHYYIWDITPDEYATGEYVCMESETETMEKRCTCLFDEQVKTPYGMRQFKTYKSPLFDEDNNVIGTIGIAHDVTNLNNIKTELAIFIDSMPYAAVVLDTAGTILNVNGKAEEYFCIKRDDVIGGNFETWRRSVLTDRVVDSNDFSDSSFFDATLDGESKTFEVNQRLIVDVFGNTTGQLRIYRDVTNEKMLEQQARAGALTDYLTGLYNRRYFYEYLETLKQDEPISLVLLDMDDFKGINDSYGHTAGDQVLCKTADLLREIFPTYPIIRWGGDEFIAIIHGDLPAQRIVEQANTLIERMKSESKAIIQQSFTASVGIALHEAGLPLDELIKRSDDALYRAKGSGKSQCRVYGDA